MPPIYVAIAVLCAMGGDCGGTFNSGLEIWPDERTELVLQNRVFLEGAAAARWKPVRLRGGAGVIIWQRQATRPCGRLKPSNPRCFGGLFHVEIDAAIERRQYAQVFLYPWWTDRFYRSFSLGLSLNRRSAHWPVYQGQIGRWPTCYEKGCWNESTWRGLGHSNTWGLAARIDRPQWSTQFRRALGLSIRNPAMPYLHSHLTATYERANWRARVELRWGGTQQERMLQVTRSFGLFRLGVIGGHLRIPSADDPIWMGAVRIGAGI